MKTELTINELVAAYIKVALGIDGIRVDIAEDTVVLVKDERWHIFLGPDSFFFVGTFTSEEFDEIEKLKNSAAAIRYVYTTEMNEED